MTAAPIAREADGRFAAGACPNRAGRPPLVRDSRVLAARARGKASRLLDWVLWAAVASGGASMAAGAGELVAAAELLDDAADRLRWLARRGPEDGGWR